MGSSADVWDEFLAGLAQGGFRALAFDQPGFGLSDNPTNYTASYRTAFILQFMDALGIDRACLVGHSMAGSMVVQTALEHPERVSQVITVGSGSLLPPLPDQGGGGRSREGGEDEQAPPTLEDARKLLEGNVFNKALLTPEVVERRHRMSVGKNFEASVERSKAREPQRDAVPLWQRVKEVPVPLLLLYGAQDRGDAAKRGALLKEMEPAVQVEIIENASHLVWWDAPEIFNRKVLDFLSAPVPS